MKSINLRSVCRHLKLALLAFALLPLASFSAHATAVTVQNPSFETLGAGSPDIFEPQWFTLPTGAGQWVSSTNSAYAQYLVGAGTGPFHFTSAADGTVVINMGGIGTLSQDLNDTVHTGDSITLSFDLGETLTGLGTGDLEAQILVNGTPIADNASFVATAGPGNWALATLTGTATSSGDLSIAFIDNTAGGNSTPWIDNVSVAAVPEPGTLALVGSGLATLLLFVRRNRLA